jgi:hypothetical protein
MMDPVADNEHPPPPREEQAGPVEPAAPAAPPALRPPTDPVPIDPEQVRQFQQFQQFQELMRQQQENGLQQGTPPPPGQLQPWGPPAQPPKRPLWQRALRKIGGKLVSLALMVLLMIAAGLFAIDYFFGPEEVKAPAHERNEGTFEETQFLAKDPYAAVRRVYSDIAYGDGPHACIRFDLDRGIDQRFAENMGGSNCEDAVQQLYKEVTDGNEYRNSIRPETYEPLTENVMRISSCEFGVSGGPALGVFTVTKVKDDQWLITDHQAEDPCTSASTAPPTS